MQSYTEDSTMTSGNATDFDALKRQRFADVFPVIRDELVTYLGAQCTQQDVIDWFEKVSLSVLPIYIN
jgi:hypothetical protein